MLHANKVGGYKIHKLVLVTAAKGSLYLGGVLRDCGSLVSQLKQHRLSRVSLGHLLVGSYSRGNFVIHFYLYMHGCKQMLINSHMNICR